MENTLFTRLLATSWDRGKGGAKMRGQQPNLDLVGVETYPATFADLPSKLPWRVMRETTSSVGRNLPGNLGIGAPRFRKVERF